MDSTIPSGRSDSERADELNLDKFTYNTEEFVDMGGDSVVRPTDKECWETPDDVFGVWNSRFSFHLDAAANETNHKCPNWFGPGGVEKDALSVSWEPWYRRGNIWLNPSYSRGTQRRFVEKAIADWYQSGCSNTCVMLLPADTSTKLFHEVIWNRGFRVEFLKGRIRFKGATGAPKFGNMVVIL